jgi:glycosyltransferase involved in cell wall biosynthesis
LRILLVNKFLYPSRGAETVFFGTWSVLEQHGHEVIPFGMLDERNVKTRYADYLVSNVDYSAKHPLLHMRTSLKAAVNVVYSFEARRKFEALVQATNPDIVHLHNIYHQISPSILDSAARLGLPVVQTLHDFKLVCPNYTLLTGGQDCERCVPGRFYHAVLHRCVKNSLLSSLVCCTEMYVHRLLKIYDNVDRFVCPSQFLYNRLAELGVQRDRMVVIPHGLSLGSHRETAESGHYILYAGSLSAGKGLSVLLQAFADVAHAGSTKLLIAGDGELKGQLQHELASDPRFSKIELLGFVGGAQLTELVRGCLFLVNPSRLHEVSPISILEAFSQGRAVVASRIGGIPELVRPGRTGLLCQPGDAASLAEQMGTLLSDPELARNMGRRAREWVEQRHSMDLYYQRIIKLYDQVAEG